ncbi:hypothetical protein [Sediminivirga luteola]|uniref:Uncharacterized protein n=1 Tax=Sediminivirga luteola TaxID=1774748 RepID=A0A8J2XJX0_9MICO|nr:hypothetical protein [Sediminivirga luteola]GGA23263.1 hypothetical protein GCM10011333_27940 [Sediminivirga luteola]
MKVREEIQAAPVAEDVTALIAVTRPIIAGLLHSIGEEYLAVHGGRENIRLGDLGRLRKSNDGDLGVAFEYAVHDAIVNGTSPIVLERVEAALRRCNIRRGNPSSILFAMEKSGAKQLIDTKRELITPDSRVLSGKRGQPVKLRGYMNQLAAAFHRPTTRQALPRSIQGLWKADLFLGSTLPDHWVGTSIKVNPRALEGAPGLRVAIVPTASGRSDAVKKDDHKNLVICPLPHDFSFMQTFHEGMRIVQALMAKDFKMPSDATLPNPMHREVARVYVERRDFAVLEVLEGIYVFSQQGLLKTATADLSVISFESNSDAETSTMLAPKPLIS